MHVEALTDESLELLPAFSHFTKFYLAGGTALALQIGHRVSVDFDFFSEEKLPEDLLQRVKRAFTKTSLVVTYRSPEQLNVVLGNVQTTFLCYPYTVIDSPIVFKDIRIATIREIAAMKAYSIGRRLSYKDYVDWYFMLKEQHIRLNDVLTFAQKKFGNDFNDRLFLGQLVSMEDVPEQKIDFLRGAVDSDIIQKFLEDVVRNFRI